MSESPTSQAHASAARRRVIVVDDNRNAADALVELLGLRGYQAWAAYDAGGALDVSARLQPDVALVDLDLPDMDGCELARRLRRAGCAPTLIALTGSGREDDRDRTRAAGFDVHLVKPVDPPALFRLLASSISGRA